MKDWEKVLLKSSDTLETAIRVLNNGAARVAMVVNEEHALLGTITDGDIRRSLLHHVGLDSAVAHAMCENPTTALSKDSKQAVLAMMKQKDLLQVPILNEKGTLVGLQTINELMDQVHFDNPVMLMAGGKGERLRPLTYDVPKPLLKVGKKPILESILEQFIEAGFHQFYISTHYKSEMVKAHFGDGDQWGVSVQYLDEEIPLGTAGSLGLLPDDLPDLPIVLMNGDLLTKVNFQHLLSFHHEQKADATMCVREYDFQVPYGVIELEQGLITSIVEKPMHQCFINAGIYVLEPSLFRGPMPLEYLDMPQLLESKVRSGGKVASFPIHEYWIDIGRMEEFERANREITG